MNSEPDKYYIQSILCFNLDSFVNGPVLIEDLFHLLHTKSLEMRLVVFNELSCPLLCLEGQGSELFGLNQTVVQENDHLLHSW